ncbi:hypothetical protein BDW68DRAFT_160728 [Aspergillus falconensis]
MISLFPLPLFSLFISTKRHLLLTFAVTIYLRLTYLDWLFEAVLLGFVYLGVRTRCWPVSGTDCYILEGLKSLLAFQVAGKLGPRMY